MQASGTSQAPADARQTTPSSTRESGAHIWPGTPGQRSRVSHAPAAERQTTPALLQVSAGHEPFVQNSAGSQISPDPPRQRAPSLAGSGSQSASPQLLPVHGFELSHGPHALAGRPQTTQRRAASGSTLAIPVSALHDRLRRTIRFILRPSFATVSALLELDTASFEGTLCGCQRHFLSAEASARARAAIAADQTRRTTRGPGKALAEKEVLPTIVELRD